MNYFKIFLPAVLAVWIPSGALLAHAADAAKEPVAAAGAVTVVSGEAALVPAEKGAAVSNRLVRIRHGADEVMPVEGAVTVAAGEAAHVPAEKGAAVSNRVVQIRHGAAPVMPAGGAGVIQGAAGVLELQAVPGGGVVNVEAGPAGVIQGAGVIEMQAQPAEGVINIQAEVIPGDDNGVVRIRDGVNMRGEIRVMGGGQLIIQNGAAQVFIGGDAGVGMVGQPAAPGSAKKTEAPETEDRIDFLNKDRLRGMLDSINGPAGTLQWRHADSTNAIPFRAAGINRVRMAPRPQEAASSNFLSSVTLTNDDYFTGRLLSLDADKLVLETEHFGTLNLERIMVRSFSPNSKFSALLYSGPTDLEGWNLGGRNSANSWIASNGALVPLMQFPITREIPGLPDQCRMAFTADWKAYPAFNFGFGAAKARGDMFGESGYNLMVSGNSIYFRRTTASEGSDNLWNINSDELGRSGARKGVFELFIDRKKAAFTLFLNGKQIKQWTDAKGYAGKGNHISFQSQVQGGLRFTDIRVSAWDGVLPDPKEEAAPAATLDGVWFVNRDRIEGSVLAIRDGKASVKSELTGEVEIPLERISEIHLAPDSRERARRNKGDVRLSLVGGATVTADLRELSAGFITAASENFAQIRIPVPRVVEMEFNIYRRKPAAEITEPDSDIPVWVE